MEQYDPPIETTVEGWDCSFRCRIGSLAYAANMGAVGGYLERDELEAADRVMEAYLTCSGPNFSDAPTTAGKPEAGSEPEAEAAAEPKPAEADVSMEYICPVVGEPVDASEIWPD